MIRALGVACALALGGCPATVDDASGAGGGGAGTGAAGGAAGVGGDGGGRPADPTICVAFESGEDCLSAGCVWHYALLFPELTCSAGIPTNACTWFEEWGAIWSIPWQRETPEGLIVLVSGAGPANPEGVIGFTECPEVDDTLVEACECIPGWMP